MKSAHKALVARASSRAEFGSSHYPGARQFLPGQPARSHIQLLIDLLRKLLRLIHASFRTRSHAYKLLDSIPFVRLMTRVRQWRPMVALTLPGLIHQVCLMDSSTFRHLAKCEHLAKCSYLTTFRHLAKCRHLADLLNHQGRLSNLVSSITFRYLAKRRHLANSLNHQHFLLFRIAFAYLANPLTHEHCFFSRFL